MVPVLPTFEIVLPWAEPLERPVPGLKLIEDRAEPLGSITLEAVELLQTDEATISRELAVIRARQLGALGERHGRAVYKVRRQIPQEWQPFPLLFSGTLWLDTGRIGGVSMFYMSFDERQHEWGSAYTGTDGAWANLVRVVRAERRKTNGSDRSQTTCDGMR